MKLLSYQEAWVIYDGLQVFWANDQFGVRYICTLVEQNDKLDKYICAPVSINRFDDLVRSKIDLRKIYCKPEDENLYVLENRGAEIINVKIDKIAVTDIPENWLPKEGFFVNPHSESDVDIVEQAIKRNRAIIYFRLNPPESLAESKIYADNLSQATRLIQRLVKHAYRKAIKKFESVVQDKMDLKDDYKLEIYAFAPGSFTLQMQTAKPADMFGHSEVKKALQVIDNVANLADSPDMTVDGVSQIGGHFATAYRDLVHFISDTGTSLEYEWASPDRQKSKIYGITDFQAKPLYEALMKRTDIGIEKVKFIGKLTKIDVKLKTWRLMRDSDGREITGQSEIDLSGLVIGTKKYELTCEERLEEELGTGKETTKYYIMEIQGLS